PKPGFCWKATTPGKPQADRLSRGGSGLHAAEPENGVGRGPRMIALGRIALLGLLSLLAVALRAEPGDLGGVTPSAGQASISDDDAHCGCGEGKMARVAAATSTFAGGVEALGRAMASSTTETPALVDRLRAYAQACGQRQPVLDAPM